METWQFRLQSKSCGLCLPGCHVNGPCCGCRVGHFDDVSLGAMNAKASHESDALAGH